jgi:putative addiction module component (TIGR02574 family)
MSTSVRDLFQQASELDEHDRATLAGLLLESLEDKVDEDVEGLWKEEIERRLAELDTHSVQGVPWDEVKAELMRRTGAKRYETARRQDTHGHTDIHSRRGSVATP